MRGSPRLQIPRGAVVTDSSGRWVRPADTAATAAATADTAAATAATGASGGRPIELSRTGVIGDGGEVRGAVVRGESAAVLRHLLVDDPGGSLDGVAPEGIRGAVQVVYIDPPYNTGGAFAHYGDDVDHELWLDALRERLMLLRETLTESGSLWLHVDDAEMAYAKVLCDEVFGRGNMISTVVVESNPKGRQLGKFFAGSHDYLLGYARDVSCVRLVPGTPEAVNPADFPRVDEQGRYRYLPLRNTNKKFNPATARTLHYPLWACAESGRVASSEFPGATEVWPVFGDLTPAVWRWSAARVDERPGELAARMVRGRAGERLDVFQIDRMREGRTKKLRSIWPAAEVGSSDSAKLEVKALAGGGEIFSTPKPEPLLLRILRATTEPGDLVLDCFAGSGTTAAVAHKAGRRWIAIELSESTVEDFLLPRLRAVVSGADRGGVSPDCDWTGGDRAATFSSPSRPSDSSHPSRNA